MSKHHAAARLKPPATKPQRPASAVNCWTGWIGLGALVLAAILIRQFQIGDLPGSALLLILPGLAMLSYEALVVKPWRSRQAAVNFKQVGAFNWPRIMTKCLAFAVAWGLLSLWFYALPFYRHGYDWVFRTLLFSLIPLAVLGAIYVAWIDRYLVDPFDNAWHFGRLITSFGRAQTDKKQALHFLLGWFIKGFFFVFLVQLLPEKVQFIRVQQFDPWISLFRFVFLMTSFMFTVDIVLALVGYASTFKLFDSHIRSPNDQWLGWFAALTCYPPFVILGGFAWSDWRKGGTFWDLWLTEPIVISIWGVALMLTLFVYVWATIAFGIRFSNLTHRGILTHGPYRIFKHPAYVAKNLYWWLAYVPWVNQISTSQAILCCTILLGINFTYYLRAKTEEAHLKSDPDYQAYLMWHDSHSLFERLK